jgi:hypothetical protein
MASWSWTIVALLAALLLALPARAASGVDAFERGGARQLKEASCDATTFPALKAVRRRE